MTEEVKEKLTDQKEDADEQTSTDNTTDENAEDYFNPFADVSDDSEEEVREEKEAKEEKEEKVEKVEKEQKVDKSLIELEEVKATVQAQKDVAKLIKENPMYADWADEIADIAAKAIVRGHKDPIEFAIRNIKSPAEWIEIGRKSGIEDAGVALKTKIGGSSLGRTEASSTDFNAMSTSDFEKFVNSVKNSA